MDKEYQKEISQCWFEFIRHNANIRPEENEKKPSFFIFLSSLAMQAMIALGRIENPLTGETNTNYKQAKFLIDTLDLIKTRTVNNLERDEESFLNECLTNLRALYMEVAKNDK
ncbi:MAG: DUF1844 domain-containing protein [Candidatus Omnitrophica bacterium]|nr:DUF1844 domain-containing protein [Candidatus Omnitrophota bacterium]MBD3269656.1 DUF1844 domain-containing protein [Candidatus Omnitrophota bacterium]